MKYFVQIFLLLFLFYKAMKLIQMPFSNHVYENRKTFNLVSFYEFKTKLSDRKFSIILLLYNAHFKYSRPS